MPHDSIGWVHTLAAVIALISGSIILAKTKGTLAHKRIGRVYALAMLVVCATSFMIYRVHGTFGILHIFAIISTITLVLGLLPMYLKRQQNPIVAHLAWMYWSVIGLYAAFAAEIFTRLPMLFPIPNTYGLFYALVGIASGAVTFVGSRYFKKKKKIWEAQFGVSSD